MLFILCLIKKERRKFFFQLIREHLPYAERFIFIFSFRLYNTIWRSISLFYKIQKWWRYTFNTNLSNSKIHHFVTTCFFHCGVFKTIFFKLLLYPVFQLLQPSMSSSFPSQTLVSPRPEGEGVTGHHVVKPLRASLWRHRLSTMEEEKLASWPTTSTPLPTTYMSHLRLRSNRSRPAFGWLQPHERSWARTAQLCDLRISDMHKL